MSILGKFFSLVGRRAPERTRIRDLRPGYVQCIEGDALAIGDPLPAPFSGTECAALSVFHQYQVKGSSGGRTVYGWTPETKFVFRRHFYVRDESGLVRVERCSRTQIFAYKFDAKKVPPETRAANLKAFRESFSEMDDTLAEFNVSIRTGGFLKSKCHELVIAEGSRVRIVGQVRMSGEALPIDARVGFRDAPAMLEFVSPPTKAMRITRIKRA